MNSNFVKLYIFLVPNIVVLLVFITGLLSSAATAVIITVIVCLVMQKRRQTKDSMNTTPSPTLIYDDITETTVKKEIVEMTSNVAYASAK